MNKFWNDRYAEPEYAYGTKPNEFLKVELAKLKPGKILFVSEGEGRNAVYAALKGWDVYAFDLSRVGKQKALELAKSKNVEIHYQLADAAWVKYPKINFDVIVFIYAQFPEIVRKRVHEEAIKWLRKQGRIIVEGFTIDQLKHNSFGPKDAGMLYTPEIIADDFAGMVTEKLTVTSTMLDEGKYHQGRAEILRFVGRKGK